MISRQTPYDNLPQQTPYGAAPQPTPYDNDYGAEDVHPALRNFNRNTFMMRDCAKKVIMGGLIGLAIGAAVFSIATLAFTASLAGGLPLGLGWLGLGIASLFPTVQAAAITGLTGAAILGAQVGGAVGLVGSGIFSALGAEDAANREEERLIAKYEQAQARREQVAALGMRRDEQKIAMERQAHAMHTSMNPNKALPTDKKLAMGPAMGPGMI